MGTPSAVARTKGSGTTASPQIKAALAALRAKRQPTSSSSNIAASSPSEEFDAPVTPVRSSSRPSPAVTVEERAKNEAFTEQADLSLEWAVKGEGKLIEDAKRTGRLNLASRSLSAVPPSVYSALLPRSSIFHPSNRQPSHFRRAPAVDFTIARAVDEGRGPARWFEQAELRSLNLSNNEIDRMSEEIGGFEELEFLDLHGNLLSSLPASIGYLENLTSLSLASNGLTAFPLPLLNLRNLRDLSLASNRITTLWPVDWRAALDNALKPPEASPSATPESAEKKATPLALPSLPADFPKTSRAPFPRLTSLSLSNNPLDHSTFLEDGFELPPRLVTLELASCGLTDSALPPALLGSLSDLKDLDLSRNELSDELFSPSLFPDNSDSRLFPALESLDLSLCPIDSLETVEEFFTRRVRRPITYVGVPEVVENLIKNEKRKNGRRIGVPADLPEGEEDGREVRVLVRECMLRLEQGRRRAKFPPTQTSLARERERVEQDKLPAPEYVAKPAPTPRARPRSPSPPPSPSPAIPSSTAVALAPATPSTPSRRRPVTLEDWEAEKAESEVETPEGSPPPYSPRSPSPARTSARQPSPPALPSAVPGQVEADAADEAVALIASVYTSAQGKTAVSLTSRSLASLPTPACGSGPTALTSATHVDLSRNLLTVLPLRSLKTWGWNRSLRVLNLSCNRIAALELLSASLKQSIPFFPALDTLDLSSNYLPSTVTSPFQDNSESQPLLSVIAALAPSLSTLSLRQNRLTSVSGISAFLLPSMPSARGLKTLDLGENKIVDLGELCEVAQRIEREGKGGWRCEELDLSMNEIKQQLPPTLGLLPHSLIIHLQGNVFRFPKREVYENAGARQVLPWLRERLGR
ncbi:Leucine-rich repeat-containing protein 40 [Rhodotorula toruloides ATCC 204091]|uniref:Leucine-rich repeat-containing protein 40 n=1 Tax=Rhodotorula toruloides TaxID=5286 RepID=A0A0K3CF64_RHOTO|nr:Leucine-rich repeat-containing protein 40 [Rhodotorula toruloides ATCC 204091]PRQ75883.1 leucine-rich repeat-containing protein 40 [Rhodotorula toruloides]